MTHKPIVTLKGLRDGIAVDIDETSDFVAVIEMLRQKVSDGKRFFAGANTKVYFKGRKLTSEEEDTLISIISNIAGVSISPKKVEVPVDSQAEMIHADIEEAFIEPESNTETEVISEYIKKNFTESNCAFYKSGLRSGQSIKYKGSVVVMGDINPGSEIVADGNVVVLGSLKGLAHAGASGDESCFVLANLLQPVQLRIAGVISSMPSTVQKNVKISPSYAYVKDGKICIAAL